MLHQWKETHKPRHMTPSKLKLRLSAVFVLLAFVLTSLGGSLGKYVQEIPAGGFNLNVLAGVKGYTLDMGMMVKSAIPDNVTEIVFGFYDEYPNFKPDDAAAKHVGETNEDKIYLHTDGTKVYILADSNILANAYSNLMFASKTQLTKIDFKNFNTSKTVNFGSMFSDCQSLTELDLSGFDTSKVTDMYSMFDNCSSLETLNISSFNTMSVTVMEYMFQNCSSLKTLDVSNFNTSKVTDMDGMFLSCSSLTSLDLSGFDTASLKDTKSMFKSCANLKTIYASSDWEGLTPATSTEMFKDCTNLVGGSGTAYATALMTDGTYAKLDEGPNSAKPGYFTAVYNLKSGQEINAALGTDVTEVVFGYYKDHAQFTAGGGIPVGATDEDLIYLHWSGTRAYILSNGKIMANPDSSMMFGPVESTDATRTKEQLAKISFDNFDTSRVTDMSYMFHMCKGLTGLDLRGFDTSNVTDMGRMLRFLHRATSIDVSSFDTSKVENMESMFGDCQALTALDVSGFDTSNVKNMSAMFAYCFELTELDVSSFNVSNVMNMNGMFIQGKKLTTIYASSDWEPAKGCDSNSMFTASSVLVGGAGTRCDGNNNIDASRAVIDQGPTSTKPGYFTHISEKPGPSYTLMRGQDFKSKIPDTTTEVVFGYYADYPQFAGAPGAVQVGATTEDLIYLHMDGTKAYVLADEKIMANESCYQMFQSKSAITKITFDNFDTSRVTDMGYMFVSAGALVELDLSGFNTKKVTSMSGVFSGCYELKKVDLSSFDTSNVTDMRQMFNNNYALTEVDVTGFNTSKVTSMYWMFANCRSLVELDLSSFDISKVTSFNAMFADCSDLKTIYASEDWNISPEAGGTVFGGCEALVGGSGTAYADVLVIDETYAVIDQGPNSDKPGYFTAVYNLKTGREILEELGGEYNNVTEVVFGYYKDHTQFTAGAAGSVLVGVTDKDLIYLHWDGNKAYILSNGKIMANPDSSKMFCNFDGTLTKIAFDNFDTSNVTNMSYMLYYLPQLPELDVTGFDTSHVTDMSHMFDMCRKLTALDVTGLDTSKVTNMEGMFYGCANLLELDLSGFDVSKVTNTKNMFFNCGSLTTIYAAEDWKIPGDSTNMFDRCGKLVGGAGTAFSEKGTQDAGYAVIDQGPDSPKPGYFTEKSYNLKSGTEISSVLTPLSPQEIIFGLNSDYQDIISGYQGTPTHVGVEEKDKIFAYQVDDKVYILADGKIMANADCSSMFLNSSATRIAFENFDTSKVTNMSMMFTACRSITELDLSGFNTSNVTNMNFMFGILTNPTKINLSSFDTSSVTDMSQMFANSSGLTELDLSKFNTSSVTKMTGMFGGCTALAGLNLSNFNTGAVEDMMNMFENCSGLTELDLSNFDTSSVKIMMSMFKDCTNLSKLDVSGFKTPKVTSMEYMFQNCSSLTELDLSGFDTNSSADASFMFMSCTNLRTIYASGDWSVTGAGPLFRWCTSLVGGARTACDGDNNIDSRYAVIDQGSAKPGYFTDVANKPELSYMLPTGAYINKVIQTDPNLTEAVFGYYKDYPQFTAGSADAVPAGATTDDLIYMHKDPEDETKVYFLSEGKIMAHSSASTMFMNRPYLTKVKFDNFDTSNATTVASTFYGCTALTEVDLSGFDITNCINTQQMFVNCSSLKRIYTDGDWDSISGVRMFEGCTFLVGGAGTAYADAGVTNSSYARIDNPGGGRPGYFTLSPKAGKTNLEQPENSGRAPGPAAQALAGAASAGANSAMLNFAERDSSDSNPVGPASDKPVSDGPEQKDPALPSDGTASGKSEQEDDQQPSPDPADALPPQKEQHSGDGETEDDFQRFKA